MSFLNPVSLPVLRFKSTDAGAPQINYNVRTAGDVKAVLKACLVTGYGAKAGAGWSIVNEVAHVAEFVSPSAAMSDYRLGIDDTSTASTTWYYQYQDVRVNPAGNAPLKSFIYADKTHADNGWQLLVTERGLVFVELLHHQSTGKMAARMTYWGQLKSALSVNTGANVMFFNAGYNGLVKTESQFYGQSTVHSSLSSYNGARLAAALPFVGGSLTYLVDVAAVDVTSEIYTITTTTDLLTARIPPLLGRVVNSTSDLGLAVDLSINDRPAFGFFCGGASSTASTFYSYGRAFAVYLDYWEY